MAWLQTMHAELIAEMSSPEAFATASRGWLTGTLPKVFPELYEGLRTRPVVRDKPRPKAALDLPWGQPGHVLGTLMTYRKHPAFGGSEVLYSDQSWKRLLDGLASYPFAVTVTISALNDQGFPAHQGYALVKVRRDLYAPSWVSFTFSADKQDTGWPESAEIQDRWAGFVREQAASVGACGGSMTDDIGPGQPALQRTTENFSAKRLSCCFRDHDLLSSSGQ